MSRIPTEYQQLDDFKLAFCQYGSGPDLLLLHGNSESKHIFEKHQIQHFANFHTYALDSRGHGQSFCSDDVLTIEQIADDVIAFCRARNIKSAFVIGYSDGGNVALHLARKAPELFPRIIAISPNTLVSGTTDDSLRTFTTIYRVMGFFKRLGLPMQKYMRVWELMLKDIGLSDEDLKSIQTRVKIIYAEKDMIKEEHILYIAGLIPGAEVEKIAYTTHMNIIRNAKAIEVMRDWLG
ncbi:MAG: alpha/beta hydrolase [Anaerolineaceae bacterium]|nr:alpha/beta hydrolase [Anaerolineaceae bacterium]